MTRVRYFFGQLLTAEAFETEQTYHIEKRRLQNRLLLGAGIVRGLEVTAAQDSGNAIKVSPGIAIDRNGNEIMFRTRSISVRARICPVPAASSSDTLKPHRIQSLQ